MEYQKILVLQTAFLGDVILATPVVKALNQIFPNAQIDTLTIPETSIVFKYNPYVTERLIFDKRRPLKKIISFLGLIHLLRKNKYDLAVSIQSSITSALLMFVGKIPNRVGFSRQKLLTQPVTVKPGIHTRIRYLKLVKSFSNKNFDSQTKIYWTDSEESKVQNLVDSIGKNGYFLIGIAPGSVWYTKKWLQEYYIELLKLLANQKVKIFLIGGKEEKQLCEEIIRKSETSAKNLAGCLTILESAALISKLNLMITNDSAPLHIANAVKTDVIAIFGPTVPVHGFFPFRDNDKIMEIDLYCRPCSKHGGTKCPEKHFRCMREIIPKMVFDEIKQRI